MKRQFATGKLPDLEKIPEEYKLSVENDY